MIQCAQDFTAELLSARDCVCINNMLIELDEPST